MQRLVWVFLLSLLLAIGATACDDEGDEFETDDSDDTDDTDSADDTNDTDDTDDTDDTEATELQIDTKELADGRVVMEYSDALQASGAEGDVTWTITEGELPGGLTLGKDGTITGSPSKSGVYEFTVQAEDDAGTVTAALGITVPKVLLLSGYSPFGTFTTNPSYDAAIVLNEEIIEGLDVRVIEIPVTWAGGWVEHADARY